MQHSAGSSLRPDAHLDAAQRPAVVAEADRLRFVARARGADRRLRRAVGAQHDDAVLVLGAGEDARIEHGPAEVHRGERHVGDAPALRLVEHPVEEEIGTAEERAARLHRKSKVATSSKRDSMVTCRAERAAPP